MHQKGFSQIISIIAVLLVTIAFLSYLLIYKSSSSNPQKQTSNLSSSSTMKLSSLFDEYKDYKIDIETTRFHNKELNISFLYPSNLYFKDGLVPKKSYDKGLKLLIAMTNTPESKYYLEDSMTQKDYINYLIECRTDPNPGGVCGEGVAPWFNVSIVKNPETIDYFSSKEVENLGKYKAISRIGTNLDGAKVYIYEALFTKGDDNYEITVSSKTNIPKDKEYKLALWLLLSTFEIKL